MNKEKHSLRNFAALESGGATHRNSSLPTKRDTKGANFENDITSEKWLYVESKCLHQNINLSVILLINALTNLI